MFGAAPVMGRTGFTRSVVISPCVVVALLIGGVAHATLNRHAGSFA
jgi:hypothetical protein